MSKTFNTAIHCSKCGSVTPIEHMEFQNLKEMTGIFLPVDEKTALSFGCRNCEIKLSLVFIEDKNAEVEDAVIEEGEATSAKTDEAAQEITEENEVDNTKQ